jgi:hypothetical protein
MYQGVCDLLAYDERGGSVEEVYGLSFIGEGAKPVTRGNREEYAQALLRHEYHDKVCLCVQVCVSV